MTPLEYIAIATTLLKVANSAYESFKKIIAALQQNKELTAEERQAFEKLMVEDAKSPYAQQQPE